MSELFGPLLSYTSYAINALLSWGITFLTFLYGVICGRLVLCRDSWTSRRGQPFGDIGSAVFNSSAVSSYPWDQSSLPGRERSTGYTNSAIKSYFTFEGMPVSKSKPAETETAGALSCRCVPCVNAQWCVAFCVSGFGFSGGGRRPPGFPFHVTCPVLHVPFRISQYTSPSSCFSFPERHITYHMHMLRARAPLRHAQLPIPGCLVACCL
jgi:hypothetical protein